MNYYSAKIDGVKMGAFPDKESAERFERAHSVPPWSAAFAEAVRKLNREKRK